jgi:hypothetical protein
VHDRPATHPLPAHLEDEAVDKKAKTPKKPKTAKAKTKGAGA